MTIYRLHVHADRCEELHVHVHLKICVQHTSIREIVKEETALRKEKEAVCCYVHVDVHVHV